MFYPLPSCLRRQASAFFVAHEIPAYAGMTVDLGMTKGGGNDGRGGGNDSGFGNDKKIVHILLKNEENSKLFDEFFDKMGVFLLLL
jgi:hypothetical protein